jgi:hypothetical protein
VRLDWAAQPVSAAARHLLHVWCCFTIQKCQLSFQLPLSLVCVQLLSSDKAEVDWPGSKRFKATSLQYLRVVPAVDSLVQPKRWCVGQEVVIVGGKYAGQTGTIKATTGVKCAVQLLATSECTHIPVQLLRCAASSLADEDAGEADTQPAHQRVEEEPYPLREFDQRLQAMQGAHVSELYVFH